MRRLSRAGLALGVLVAGALSAFPASPAQSQTATCDATAGDTSKIEGSSPRRDFLGSGISVPVFEPRVQRWIDGDTSYIAKTSLSVIANADW